MKLDKHHLSHFLLSGLIMHAERTLAASKVAGYRGRSSAETEELLGKLYDERRAVLEEMMQAPFRTPEHARH